MSDTFGPVFFNVAHPTLQHGSRVRIEFHHFSLSYAISAPLERFRSRTSPKCDLGVGCTQFKCTVLPVQYYARVFLEEDVPQTVPESVACTHSCVQFRFAGLRPEILESSLACAPSGLRPMCLVSLRDAHPYGRVDTE